MHNSFTSGPYGSPHVFFYAIVMGMESYQEVNARTISGWVDEGWQWGRPIDHETYEKAKAGSWDILLTPTRPVPHDWFGQLRGKSVLGLASGGGQQMPVFSALGAECTLLDLSDRQLDGDRMVAQREGYSINIIKADMTKPLPFADESFDLIFNPVSLCYVEKVEPILAECHRILRRDGILLIAFDNGLNFITDEGDEEKIVRGLPFNPLTDPSLYRKEDGYQFSHSFSEQIGGLVRSGFVIRDVYEDTNGYGRLHELGISSFWAVKAVKTC